MKTEPAADAGRLEVERFRPLPARDGSAPAMHDPVWEWTTRPPCGLVMFPAPRCTSAASSRIIDSVLNAAPGFPSPNISLRGDGMDRGSYGEYLQLANLKSFKTK